MGGKDARDWEKMRYNQFPHKDCGVEERDGGKMGIILLQFFGLGT